MAKKLYVGNIPYSITDRHLEDMFSEYGAVESVKVITDRASGRSKGFAFVEMVNPEDAQKAIDALNGADCQGRAMTVSEARPQPEGQRSAGGAGGGYRDRGDRGGDRGDRGGRGGNDRYSNGNGGNRRERW